MIVVTGGHSRSVGKTSVIEGLIRGLPLAFTAVKITQSGHGVCSSHGRACDCRTGGDHPYAVTEEHAPSETDSGRFLAAGAVRSYWVRTPVGGLGKAMPSLRRILDQSGNVIIESNSVLEYLVPDLYLIVLDCRVRDMKDSARRHLDRAGALIYTSAERGQPWGLPPGRLEGKPSFDVRPPGWSSPELIEFVRRTPVHPASGTSLRACCSLPGSD